MTKLSRDQMRNLVGGKAINSCPQGQVYVICSGSVYVPGAICNCTTYSCTSSCMNYVPAGCTTNTNTSCINGVSCTNAHPNSGASCGPSA